MSTTIQDTIKPVAYLETHAEDLIQYVNDAGNDVIITQDGEARAVLMGLESYQKLKNELILLKSVANWEKAITQGKGKPVGEVIEGIRNNLISHG